MSNIQHGRGDSRSNEGKALSFLATRDDFAMVLVSTGGDGARLDALMRAFMKEYY
jgi:hypothetical protein